MTPTETTRPSLTPPAPSRDAAGRIKTVHNPRRGEEQFTRDASGGLAAVTAGDLVQEWAYRERYLAEHTRRVDSVSDASALFCGDKDGRITGLTRAGTVTRYGYDGARLACCQAHG